MLIQKLPQRKYICCIHANWLKIMYVSISQIDSMLLFFVFAKVGKGQLLSKDERFWNKKSCSGLFISYQEPMVIGSCYYIKQIDSMLPCVCAVIDHRGCQNVVTTSVTHLAIASCDNFLFLPHFEVICDVLPNRGMATWNLFVNSYKSTSVLSRMPFFDWRRFSLFMLLKIVSSVAVCTC